MPPGDRGGVAILQKKSLILAVPPPPASTRRFGVARGGPTQADQTPKGGAVSAGFEIRTVQTAA
jgi:hypothetical protein